MIEVALSESFEIILFDVGFIIVISLLVAYVFKKIGIPAVMGLLVGGIIIGFLNSFRTFLLSSDLESFRLIVTELAVGYIAYDIGNEIDLQEWKNQLSKYYLFIIGGTLVPLLLVTLTMIAIFHLPLGLAIILGAIAMTTSPIITSEILGDYHQENQLNHIVLFLLAFDSFIAILVINMAITIVSVSSSGITLLGLILVQLILKLFISIILAIVGGLVILFMVRIKALEERSILEWILGVSLVILGLTLVLQGSVILTMLFFGIILKTMESRYEILTEHVLQIELLLIPVVLMFYIFMGMSIDLAMLSGLGLFILLGYFFARIIGKITGIRLASRLSNIPGNIKNNLHYYLITQGGVAIALAGLTFNQLVTLGFLDDAKLIITVVSIAVILSEIIGLIVLRFRIRKSRTITIT